LDAVKGKARRLNVKIRKENPYVRGTCFVCGKKCDPEFFGHYECCLGRSKELKEEKNNAKEKMS
jgi:heterodisulfide reductase subunit A-like polyferredoxin